MRSIHTSYYLHKPPMESLLSLSFDYLSSFDGVKIRKGLKQVEGLLAQICLSRSTNTTAAERRRSVVLSGASEQSPKDLSSLKDDPAFREFFKLQEGFEWNVGIRLIACLERLLGKGSSMFFNLYVGGIAWELTIYNRWPERPSHRINA